MKLINKHYNQRLRPMIATLLLVTFVNEVQPQLAAPATSTSRRSTLELLSPLERLKISWRPGEQKQIDELKNKVVVLYFWSYKSPTSVKKMPSMMDIADKFSDVPVTWLAIHDASLSAMDELDAKLRALEKLWGRRLNLTTVLDERSIFPTGGFVPQNEDYTFSGSITARHFGAYHLPSVVIIPQSGKEVRRVSKDDVEKTVRQLLMK